MVKDSILRVHASGDNYTVGLTHGRAAKEQIHRLKDHYAGFILCKLPWEEARNIARHYERFIAEKHGDLYEEMKGIAEGSGAELIDIVALNSRTELAFGGKHTGDVRDDVDGCSSYGWRSGEEQWTGQNWDWKSWGRGNLVLLEIDAYALTGRPAMKTVTEAGIVGKIGYNEHGVSVQMNALRGLGRNLDGLPTHLIQRRMLERKSAEECVKYIQQELEGHGAACVNYLIGDPTTSLDIEIHPYTHKVLRPKNDILVHTNHPCELDEKDFEPALSDSKPRQARLEDLLGGYVQDGRKASFEGCRGALSDRSLGEAGLCRFEEETGLETVFNITVNCTTKVAEVKLGRPDEDGELIKLSF